MEKENEHITVFTIRIKDPETGHAWGCWEKYIKGQYSREAKFIDRDMETEMARLMNLGFKVLKSGVTCCLRETCYDKSITDKLKEESYYTVSYIQ